MIIIRAFTFLEISSLAHEALDDAVKITAGEAQRSS